MTTHISDQLNFSTKPYDAGLVRDYVLPVVLPRPSRLPGIRRSAASFRPCREGTDPAKRGTRGRRSATAKARGGRWGGNT